MILLFLYDTFSPFLSFVFFMRAGHICPVTHDSSSEVASDCTEFAGKCRNVNTDIMDKLDMYKEGQV